MHMNLYLTHICLKEASQGFLTARDQDTNKARTLEVSTCQTNMAAGCDRTIVIWKGVFKQFNTIQFLCDEIQGSSNCTRNICSLQSIVYDQMEEASFMGLTAATIMAITEGHRTRQI